MAFKLDMADIRSALLLVLGLGLVLLVLRGTIQEGFVSSDTIRCGVEDGPCPVELKCINGFCAKTDPLPKVDKNPVDILEAGEAAPYF
jgi:hypothetical protein